MALRKAGKQNKKSWTWDELQSGFDEFFRIFGKYPTAHEIDAFEYLPSTRSLERSFGGLRAVRAKLKLGETLDFRTGTHGADRSIAISTRGHSLENDVYTSLCARFDTRLVHREYFFNPKTRARADFFVYDASGNFYVDVFYANDIFSFAGCINSKLRKYTDIQSQSFPTIFLQMNEDISNIEIEKLLKNKSNKIPDYIRVMDLESFSKFCEQRIPLSIV